ncbi:N-acetylmuramoyl-L-alanine amidase [Xanthobacter sp. KR7-65]|uniref:N-acetylmuramoyl-L-alanine amidase n=1 Tax=Xanthobacter sp. KR7-65 TaxID=3156612 RepID=UPI0032B58E74
METPLAPDTPLVDAVVPSPNFGPRKAQVDMLVLHYTGMASAEAAIDLLRTPASEVSCHYVVREDGSIVQMVAEAARAWHAGVSAWEGVTDTNSRSIGIEIVNGGHDFGLPAFPDTQMARVIALSADIVARHAIRADRVLAHSDVAPARKRDPGERFPWDLLHGAGVGHLVPEAQVAGGRFFMLGDRGEPVAALKAMLGYYGYAIALDDAYDAATAEVVTAFQRHFRPSKVDGVADASTILTLRELIATRPGDAPAVA